MDAEGNTTIYSYTDADELESVSNGLSSVSYTYNDATGQLSSIANGDAVYNFTYNDYGATESIKAGSTDIAVNTYRPNNGKLLSTEFAGTTLNYTYDALNQVTQKSYTGDTVTYKYDGNGNLVQRSQTGGVTWDFVYDNAGMLVGSSRDDVYWAMYKYDAAGRQNMFLRVANGHTRRTAFAYNKFEQATHVSITGGSAEVTGANTYDALGRLTKKQWTRGDGTVFSTNTYKAGPNGTTSTQLDTVQFGSGTSTVDAGRKYEYDNVGNIVKELHRNANGTYTEQVQYVYDAASQLIRVNDNVNGETVLYTYDTQGNITRRTYHTYADEDDALGAATRTDTWNYGGPDGNTLLTSTIDGVTTNYSYPHFGIPSNWTGNRTLTWRNGRTLASIANTSFAYDGEGQRISKTTGGVTTEYIYEGGKLVMQKQGNTALFFLYDTSGLFGFDHIVNGSTEGTYYYRIDGKGEIIALTNAAGEVVANYIYDAWGFPTGITDADGNTITSGTHIGIINPIRYKGYCYDTETGLYYVSSRYYDPEIGRWINADGQLTTGSDLTGLNLFAYCGNNPVNRIDPTGEAWWHWALGAAVVAVAAVATVVTCGGFAAAATAVCMVGSGVAAATTASTVAAGAFIGSATVYGMAVLSAASTSNSVQEFNDQGNWGTVAATAFGGLTGGYDGYAMSKAQATQTVADDDTFLPDSFYSKHAPKQSTPNSSYTNYTYNNYTGKYEKSTAYYDFAGRQNIRIDWTNHGYSNHGNPHVHYTTYNSQYRDGFSIRWD